jgi:hypothetical protein
VIDDLAAVRLNMGPELLPGKSGETLQIAAVGIQAVNLKTSFCSAAKTILLPPGLNDGANVSPTCAAVVIFLGSVPLAFMMTMSASLLLMDWYAIFAASGLKTGL